MSKPIFTPGPWHESDDISDPCYIVGKGRIVCSIKYHEPYDEADANAHLIAAAPEMYAMLERIMDYRTGGPFIANPTKTEEIYNLLAKARGEVRE